MAKAKTAYVCTECGSDHNKWQGQCGGCGAWNTLNEIVLEPASGKAGPARHAGWAGRAEPARITALKVVSQIAEVRTATCIGELDRVLGGGLVDGSVVLVGGDPGIGKSTLLLQALALMSAQVPALYVTGEESLAQVAGRAQRLGLPLEHLQALAETCVEKILAQAAAATPVPRLLVADSIQTLWPDC